MGEGAAGGSTSGEPVPEGAPEPIRTDYLTFAAGALPVSVAGAGATIGADFGEAIDAIDGGTNKFTLNRRFASATTDTEFVYELPALTTFERFAIPNILETPSPSQTFSQQVQIEGSASAADSGFQTLASATLAVHSEKGQVTEIPVATTVPVRWVKVRLVGGIEDGATFFEFSEVIGNGSQEPVAMVDHFTGVWKATFGLLELKQEGAAISGCADNGRKTVTGTVTGNLARATFVDNTSGTTGAFIVGLGEDGTIWGVRSDQRAPFRLYTGPPAPDGTTTPCSDAPERTLGCGSVLHGINFDYNSATIRPDSEPVLQALLDGLQADSSAKVVIEGHTSSEGSDRYNQDLSERRAQAVVTDLVRRGIDQNRIRAVGKGEGEPIAGNDTETGRSLNRRVEVECS